VTIKVETTRVPESRCLGCGAVQSATTSLDGQRPSPGDFTVCLECGHLMVFADDLTVRELTEGEMHDIAGSPDLILIQRLREKYIRDKLQPETRSK
jgi:hypothetical protein